MTLITRPCPHCGVDYDITRRFNGDQCWCPCGKWFRVVCRLHGQVELVPCEPPPFLGAQEPTEAAALLTEMSALRAELEAVKAESAALVDALERLIHMAECDSVPGSNTLRQARAAIDATIDATIRRRAGSMKEEAP